MSVSPSRLIADVVRRFVGVRVLVVGEAILDTYLSGSARRICPEAPVPVVDVAGRRLVPGGAANAACNAAALRASVDLLSVVGSDFEADQLRQVLEQSGVSTASVLADSERQTLVKQRVVADGQTLIRFDSGTTAPLSPTAEAALCARLRDVWSDAQAVVVSDYGYGAVTSRTISVLAELQRAAPRALVIDSRNLAAYRDVHATVAKPNYRETLRLLAESERFGPARVAQVVDAGTQLRELTGASALVVTLDADGAIVLQPNHPPHRLFARAAAHPRAAGAGDTFGVTLAVSLAVIPDVALAGELAAAAAGVVVAKDATAICTSEELAAQFEEPAKYVNSAEKLEALAASYREQRRRIVFTNGCFDLLHRGHTTYLSRARALGDVLLVALNSDASISRLKGPGRPINSLEDRIQVLTALTCVDHVVAFEEDTPARLIELVRPDIYVKGGDYEFQELPEAPLVESLGGSVQLLPYVAQRSTTGLIERILATRS